MKTNNWEKQFDENLGKWLSPDPLEPQYMIPDIKAIKSFIRSIISKTTKKAVEKTVNELHEMAHNVLLIENDGITILSRIQDYAKDKDIGLHPHSKDEISK